MINPHTKMSRVRIEDVGIGYLIRVKPYLSTKPEFWGVIFHVTKDYRLLVVDDTGRIWGATLFETSVVFPIPSLWSQIQDCDRIIYRHWFKRFKGWPEHELPHPARELILQRRCELKLREYDGRGLNAGPTTWRGKIMTREIYERHQQELHDAMFPEHAKLKKLEKVNQSNGDFIEWLKEEKGLILAEWVASEEELEKAERAKKYEEEYEPQKDFLMPAMYRLKSLLADFHGIDERKLEEEKQKMLDLLNQGR